MRGGRLAALLFSAPRNGPCLSFSLFQTEPLPGFVKHGSAIKLTSRRGWYHVAKLPLDACSIACSILEAQSTPGILHFTLKNEPLRPPTRLFSGTIPKYSSTKWRFWAVLANFRTTNCPGGQGTERIITRDGTPGVPRGLLWGAYHRIGEFSVISQ